MGCFVIGLTGGVASGKTEAAGYLARLGARVLDADQVSREVAELPGIRKRLEEEWPQVFEGGKLDRGSLRKIVFSSREDLEKLNRILHPPIISHILREIETCKEGVCVVVAPLLIESGLHQVVDEIWVMDLPGEVQIKRLMERDKLGRDEALRIIKSQISGAERLAHAHRIIDNGGSFEKTKALLDKEWELVGKSAGNVDR